MCLDNKTFEATDIQRWRLDMTTDELVHYWVDTSNDDYVVMENLFDNGHHASSLFLGHLVVEKLLKAYYVKNAGVDCPRIHDLLKIATLAGLEVTDSQRIFLDEVTTFNILARYSDYKRRFSENLDREFTALYAGKIKEFRQWLLQQIAR